MKKIFFGLAILSLYACEKEYEIISEDEFQKLTIFDTLSNQSNRLILKVGNSPEAFSSRLLLKANRLYLFDYECGFENDSILQSYYPAFIIDDEGEFRKNGVWVYCRFYTKGSFPFNSKGIQFSVDSIPPCFTQKVPTEEGIYFYQNKRLKQISREQSVAKFKEKEQDGFYFFPNSGRLWDRVNISGLE